VGLGWAVVAAFGALPYVFAGTFGGYTDAFFESISGFTTTGASVMANIEANPRGILLWRSLTQWLGGMGIVLLSLAILPVLGVGGMQLFRAEMPGPTQDRIAPRIKVTARILWEVYLLFTVAEILLLTFGGLSVYDATTHAFTTMATGGFSVKNASIGAYHTPYVQVVITLFMLIAGTNFYLHYRALRGNFAAVYRDREFLFYVSVVAAGILLIWLDLCLRANTPTPTALRLASFQAVSITTTTGYSTADFDQWPHLARTVLFVLMFTGGGAGSTGGSIKHVRILLLVKAAVAELSKLIHPHAVIQVRLGGKPVSQGVLAGVTSSVFLYLGIFALGSVVMACLGLDLVSAVASVAATLGNIGPGFGSVGAARNYAHVPDIGKWLLSGFMLVGRLELYTVLVLLVPRFWKMR